MELLFLIGGWVLKAACFVIAIYAVQALIWWMFFRDEDSGR